MHVHTHKYITALCFLLSIIYPLHISPFFFPLSLSLQSLPRAVCRHRCQDVLFRLAGSHVLYTCVCLCVCFSCFPLLETRIMVGGWWGQWGSVLVKISKTSEFHHICPYRLQHTLLRALTHGYTTQCSGITVMVQGHLRKAHTHWSFVLKLC